MDKYFKAFSKTKEGSVELNCEINSASKATIKEYKGLLLEINKEGNPSYINTALSEEGLNFFYSSILELPEGCKNCLNSVRQNCAQILLNKYNDSK